MAGKKKDKKARKAEKKAAKKAKKEALKAEQKAAAVRRVAPKAAPKAAARVVRRAAPKTAAKKAAAKKSPAKKKAVRRAARPAVKARPHQERREPESLRLRSAGPSFTVNDLERSLAFYRDVLGFTPKERWEEDGVLQGIEMLAGSVTFWLGQDDWKKGRDRVKGQGFRMYCSTTQDIDTLAERIRSAGGSLLEEPRDQPWGGRSFAVADPDGFTITFASGV